MLEAENCRVIGCKHPDEKCVLKQVARKTCRIPGGTADIAELPLTGCATLEETKAYIADLYIYPPNGKGTLPKDGSTASIDPMDTRNPFNNPYFKA